MKLDPKDVERIKDGDIEPLGKIYIENRHFCIVNLYHQRHFDLADVEDAYTEAIFILQKKIVQGDFENINVGSFLLQITHNNLKNKYKRDRRSVVLDIRQVEQYLELKKAGQKSQILSPEDEKKVDAILIAINNMNENCRTLLTKYWLEEIPLKELQELLGYGSYNSIRSTKSRCQKKLTEKVKEILAQNNS